MSKDPAKTFVHKSRVTIDGEKLKALYALVGELYMADDRPWVIGYSGGKDSTTVVQVVWAALERLDEQQRTKPVFVISSDTGVETPVITAHLENTLERIASAAKERGMPITCYKVMPQLDDTFWVNLIGRGYPAPYNRFRWCTDRLKIKPATRFIYDQIGHFGEVILALGARKSESATRAQVMSNRTKVGEHLSRHCDIPGAWVVTPIEDWTTDDVWHYLLSVPSPWGGSNRELVTMYRNAQAGECPLVVDTSTPSCGNSRFGCWVCTVVKQDKSMEAMVDGGQDWLEPMLDFRDWLAETLDPANKAQCREHQRRNGRVETFVDANGNTKMRWGPYKLTFRQDVLRRLLEVQVAIRENGPDPDAILVTVDELKRIRQLWRQEAGDWQDSLPEIYSDIIGEQLGLPQDDWSGMGASEMQVLEEVAQRHGLVPQLLTELFDAEREQHGMRRRSQIYNRIEEIYAKDWLTREQAMQRLHVADPSACGDEE